MQYEHFSRHLRKKYSTSLHPIDQFKQKSIEDRKVFQPYFNQCILKDHRQICYENLVLLKKLERIKNQNLEKDYRNHSPFEKESEISSSGIDDDQATAADVDASIEYCDSPSSNHVYQHLNNIDTKFIRDAIPLSTSKHFSICILPHFDSDTMKSINNHSKVLLHDRQYAFKKEILYN